MDNEKKCPFSAQAASGRANRDWWPNQLNLDALHTKHPSGRSDGRASSTTPRSSRPSISMR